MKKFAVLLSSLMLAAVAASTATAAPFLQDYAFNIDGSVSYLDSSVGSGSFNFSTGLGSYTIAVSGTGSHYIGALFDHDSRTDFLKETGTKVGTDADPNSILSWEYSKPYNYTIEQDGTITQDSWGAIYNNFENNSLAKNSGIFGPEDVAMALIRQFDLAAGETGYVTFNVSATPLSGFYLQQTDLTLDESIYFSSSFRKSGGGEPVPEPSTFVLLGSALAGLGLYARKRRNG